MEKTKNPTLNSGWDFCCSDNKQNLLDRGFKHAAMTRVGKRISLLLNSRDHHHGHLDHRARRHRDDLAGPEPVWADPLQS